MNATTTTTLPPGYTLRVPVEDDIPALMTLIRAYDDAEFGQHDDWDAEDILRDWTTISRETDSWLIAAPDGTLAAYATIFNQGHGHLFGDGYVHPAQTGQGLGVTLMRLVEARARELVDSAPEGARVSLAFGTNGLSEPARRLMTQEGYAPIRNYYRMRIDLTEQPQEPVWPEGVTLRTFVAGQDERAIFDATEEAFSDHWGHTPREFEKWLTRTALPSFDPSLWFLAEEQGSIAGFALCRNKDKVGWLDTLGVLRPWRKHGLGMALIQQTFAEYWRRGQHTVVLGVDAQNLTGALRLYEKAGMHVAMRFATYEKELRAGQELATQELSD